ncbi:2'-5' RNA ligase family protein [Antrihabitans spumae]|uniref:2'-5' RNA ligase family protein n=1 Tax=Antrihabitans spumae TaxID=3373370 RepID=A0ABW7KIS2_9NOCA
MVQSVELLLDEDAEAAVIAQWQLLVDAGLPAQGGHHRPHVTAAVASELWPSVEQRLERELDFIPIPVRVGAIVLFRARVSKGPGAVLVRLVVPSAPLLALHRRIHDIVAECPGTQANLAPDEWTPHVTLARRLPRDRLGSAVATVLDEPDITGYVAGIRRWDSDNRLNWQIT